MTNISIIENKISQIKQFRKILKGLSKYSKKEIENNIMLRSGIERLLQNICQACIDLANLIISYKKERKPVEQREYFLILVEEHIISREMAETMIRLIGFRNILVHEYARVDYDIVYDVLTNRMRDIDNFVKTIKTKILKN